MKKWFRQLRENIALIIAPELREQLEFYFSLISRPSPRIFTKISVQCVSCGRVIEVPKLSGLDLTEEEEEILSNIKCSRCDEVKT